MSDVEITLYDGLILIQPPQGKLSYLYSTFISTNYPHIDKLNAYRHMLPKWVHRIRHGETANVLANQLEQATTQQILHCTDYGNLPYVEGEIVKVGLKRFIFIVIYSFYFTMYINNDQCFRLICFHLWVILKHCSKIWDDYKIFWTVKGQA